MTQVSDRTRPTVPADKLEQAIKLAKSGKKIEACNVLRRVVAMQPVNQAAWLWLAAVAPDQAEAGTALAQARKINPAHPALPTAEQWLANRFSAQPPTQESKGVEAAAPALPQTTNPFGFFNKLVLALVILAVLIGSAILFLGLGLELKATAQSRRLIQNQALAQPEAAAEAGLFALELETARAERDWARIIAILQTLHEAEPQSQLIGAQLAEAHLQEGVALRQRGFIEQALASFEQAVALSPDHLRAHQELRLASNYLEATRHYQQGHWPQAITGLEAVWAEEPAYVNVRDLLYSAHYNHGLARQAAGALTEAMAAFEAALALRPDLADLHLKIAEIEFDLAPQTEPAIPIPSVPVEDRLVIVGIAEQRMHVYEGEKKVFDFLVSTGEPGRDTAIGEFEIQNKIDVAYASTWNLDMPNWLGIYWAGPLQNGIHGLPTVKHTGYKLWDGYLGQRVSYGCVILGDEDITTLYRWAEVGARVKIVPSLADWQPGE